MKKHLIASAILATVPVLASAQGFYAGGNLGISSSAFDAVGSGIDVSLSSNDTLSLGAYLGYQVDLGQGAFIAGELDYFFLDSKRDIKDGTSKSTFTREPISSISFLFGQEYGGTSVYGRLGWAQAKTELKSSGSSVDKKADAWVIGAGVKYPITRNTAVRFDYRYLNYGSYRMASGAAAKIEGSEHLLNAGLEWAF